MPQASFVPQMLSGLGGALGQVGQVEVDLHGRDARQVLDGPLAVDDAAVVGADDLHVGAAVVAAQPNRVGSHARVACHVDADKTLPDRWPVMTSWRSKR